MPQTSELFEAGATIVEKPVSLKTPRLSDPPPPTPLPIIAALVPVIGGVVLFLVLKSPYALIFAALGPLMLAASYIDGKRNRRKTIKQNKKKYHEQLRELGLKITKAQEEQLEILAQKQPDLKGFLLHNEQIWRPGGQLENYLNIGRGPVLSAIELNGETENEELVFLEKRSRRLDLAPVTLKSDEGLVIAGANSGINNSVARALVLQLCARIAPEDLAVVWGESALECEQEWLNKLPHAISEAKNRLWISWSTAELIPDHVKYMLLILDNPQTPAPRCAARLIIGDGINNFLLTPNTRIKIQLEGVTIEQAAAISEFLAEHGNSRGATQKQIPSSLCFNELIQPKDTDPSGLACVIAHSGAGFTQVDLVNEGPHALVTGMTGSGKSELLLCWILAMCQNYSPDQLRLLLIDFKGGSAFNALINLPHLSSLVTDLDQSETARVVKALRAEIFRREQFLAGIDARNILEARGRLARLVVVVDEYAALINSDTEFAKLFADIAARGRSLGIHLILGSQRAAGVFNEGIMANCPLRISLRVNDENDSRVMLGVSDAAQLSGAKAQRGIALILSSDHDRAIASRIALSSQSDVKEIATKYENYDQIPAICPPPLLTKIPIEQIRGRQDEELVLGMFDDPEHQNQGIVSLPEELCSLAVVGDAASGKTNTLKLLAEQSKNRKIAWLSVEDPEAACDEISLISEAKSQNQLIFIDDLDQLLLRLDPEHAQWMQQQLEQLIRQGRNHKICYVLSARPATSPASRVLELCERKILLHCNSKAEFLSHGGLSIQHSAVLSPGRAQYQNLSTQIALGSSTYSPPEHPARNITLLDYLHGHQTAPIVALISNGTHTTETVNKAILGTDWQSKHLDQISAQHLSGTEKLVVYADPESWQRRWEQLNQIKSNGAMLVDPNSVSHFRLLSGSRQLPPYIDPAKERLWGITSGGTACRISLEADT